MGHIYPRGSIYWIKYYRNGRPYQESTKSEKEADAKRLLKEREGEIAKGEVPVLYPRHGTPYEVEYSKNPTTEGAWRHYFCKLCRGDSQT